MSNCLEVNAIKKQRSPLFAALVVAALVLSTIWKIDGFEIQQFRERHRAQVVDKLSILRAKLEMALNSRLHLVHGLAAFAKTQPNFTEPQFVRFAQELQGDLQGIRSLQLAPGAVVTYIYPLESNAAAKGHDLLADPARRDAVKEAIDSRKFVIAGPVALKQGGVALIGRKPIFVDSGAGDAFWGLAIILLDFEPLLREAGFFEGDLGLQLGLRGKNATGSQGDVFYGNAEVFDTPGLVTSEVVLPYGSWQIGALPSAGWHQQWSGRVWFWLSGIALAAALGWLSFFMMQRPILLRAAIERATSRIKLQSTAMEASVTSIVITDEKGVIRWFNPAFTAMTGYQASEAIGQTPRILKSGHQSAEVYSGLWNTILSGKPWTGELVNRRKDGSLYYEQQTITPVLNDEGRIESFIAIKEDITERKEAMDTIRRHQVHLQTILDNVAEGIISINNDLQIVSANPAVEHIFGYRSGELIGQKLSVLVSSPHQEVHDSYIQSYLEQCFASHEHASHLVFLNREFLARRKDGLHFLLEITVSYIEIKTVEIAHENRDDTQFIVTLRDISERRKAEKALAEAREKFFQQEKMASIGSLAAGIIHEVGNPISAIAGLVQEISSVNEHLSDETLANIDLINLQINRLLAITHDVAEFTAPQTDDMQLLDLNRLIQGSCRLLSFDERMRNIRFQLDLDPDLPAVMGSSTQIHQVLVNLALNSADALKGSSDPKIIIKSVNHNATVELNFLDNGAGMDAQTQANAFDAFFTTKAVGKGTGLGLSVCYSIIKRHHGEISISSVLNQGTEVRILLPINKCTS